MTEGSTAVDMAEERDSELKKWIRGGMGREGKGREGRKDDAHRRPYLEQKEGLRERLRGGIESFGIGV